MAGGQSAPKRADATREDEVRVAGLRKPICGNCREIAISATVMGQVQLQLRHSRKARRAVTWLNEVPASVIR